MKQISNKTLTFLLLIVIVVSITATIISINKINQLIILQLPIIGMASQTGTGMINVTIAGATSITATDTTIQYGSCSPATSYGCNATSNISNSHFNCSCSGGSAPDNITIKNDGNRFINVSVKTGVLAETFIGGNTPYGAELYFSVRNSTDKPGCTNATASTTHIPPANFDDTNHSGMQWYWKNFSVADTEYLACANLSYGTSANSIYVFTKIFAPANAPAAANKSTTLTFTAANW